LEEQSNHLGLLLQKGEEFFSGFIGVDCHLNKLRTNKDKDSYNREQYPTGSSIFALFDF